MVNFEKLYGVSADDRLQQLRETRSGQIAERIYNRMHNDTEIPADYASAANGAVSLPVYAATDIGGIVTIIQAIGQVIIDIMGGCPEGGLFGGRGILSGFKRSGIVAELRAARMLRQELPSSHASYARPYASHIMVDLKAKDDAYLLTVTDDLYQPSGGLF